MLLYEELTKSGKYLKADETLAQAQVVRSDNERALCKAFKGEQRAHLKDLLEVHRRQVRELNEAWDNRVSDYRVHVARSREALEERLQMERQDFITKLRAETEPRTPHWSKFYLERRRVEERLVRQRRFDEAKEVKAEADAMQEAELAEFHLRRDAKIHQLGMSHQDRQLRQRQSFERRAQATLEDFERTRRREMQKLLSRIRNVVSEVQQQQKIHATTVRANPRLHSPCRSSNFIPNQDETGNSENRENAGE